MTDKKTTCFRLQEAEKAALQKIAENNCRTMTEQVRFWIKQESQKP